MTSRQVAVSLAIIVGASLASLLVPILGARMMPAAVATPPCHAYCDVITRGALSRPEGPLPHKCRFFAECGCDYQCPSPAP